MKTLVRTLGLLTATTVLAAGMVLAADATPPAGGAAPKMAGKMGKMSKKGHKAMKSSKKGHKAMKSAKKGAKKSAKKPM
jgi:hypothetical protein